MNTDIFNILSLYFFIWWLIFLKPNESLCAYFPSRENGLNADRIQNWNSGKWCIYDNGSSTSVASAAVMSYFHIELQMLAGNKPKAKMPSTASDQLKKLHDCFFFPAWY